MSVTFRRDDGAMLIVNGREVLVVQASGQRHVVLCESPRAARHYASRHGEIVRKGKR